MGPDDQIVIPGVNQNVMDRHHRKIAHMQLNPVPAPRKRNKNTQFRPGINHLGVTGVFPHHPNVGLSGKISADIGPGPAEIRSPVYIRPEIIQHMTVKGTIGQPRRSHGRFHVGNRAFPRETRDIISHVFPVFPAVHGHLEVSVIGARP